MASPQVSTVSPPPCLAPWELVHVHSFFSLITALGTNKKKKGSGAANLSLPHPESADGLGVGAETQRYPPPSPWATRCTFRTLIGGLR